MREKMKAMVVLMGGLFSLGMTMLMYVTFLMAFFNPSKSIRITVDALNEGVYEFVLIPLFIMFSLVSFYYSVVKKVRFVKEEEKSR